MVGVRVVILAATLRTNALGRALTMADMLPPEFTCLGVWAPAAPDRWVGAAGRTDVHEYSGDARRALLAEVRAAQRLGEQVIVWVSKGFPWAAKAIRDLPDGALVVADFDDNDVAFAREFVEGAFFNRLKLNPLRPGSPERLSRSQQVIRGRASLTTVSSHSLAEDLGILGPIVRLPHGRPAIGGGKGGASGFRNLAFLGTMRAHKGMQSVIDALRADPRLTVTMFEQPGLSIPSDLTSRWRLLTPNTPLNEAYAAVDVSILPLDRSSGGALVQLPAKAIDAAAAFTPIVATPTPVLDEYFEAGYVPIADWSGLGAELEAAEAKGQLRAAAAAALGQWREELSTEVLRERVRREFSRLVADGAR